MKTYGLIGYRLGYSFSKGFFKEKFEKEGLTGHEYLNFELDRIDDFPSIFEANEHIAGLNCTIPYKQQIIPYLDEIDEQAAEVGAVNTIKIIRSNNQIKLKGYNTDCYGFEHSIVPMLKSKHRKALILGTGGASKAIKYVLTQNKIEYISATTKEKLDVNEVSYNQVDESLLKDHLIVINATPLGTYPKVDNCPAIPYEFLTPDHVLYDLVYNPEETLFMRKGNVKGAATKNGLEMLHLQAEKAWEIWNE
ncbi:shikimate dehydrogenase [uncultured Sunxiuqinia sp.]|uniref:shikimate dehydrogenase family protein n=1 Tax=uncultured Sunxiuqinia sp. TaxID=1573825 RepID=UPI0030D865A9|tara:strand:- start:112751 stop:113500 length:750 start_codon:yes stop_codon:yes gene_type:complete